MHCNNLYAVIKTDHCIQQWDVINEIKAIVSKIYILMLNEEKCNNKKLSK